MKTARRRPRSVAESADDPIGEGGTLRASVNACVAKAVRRVQIATLLAAVGIVLLAAGVALLGIAGFEALRLLPLPDAAALAIIGAVALGGGAAAIRALAARNRS